MAEGGDAWGDGTDLSSVEHPLQADGAAGLTDRRLDRALARAVPVDEALQMVTLGDLI